MSTVTAVRFVPAGAANRPFSRLPLCPVTWSPGMRRAMYITVGVLGIMLVVAAGVAALLAFVPPGDATVVAVAEVGVAAVGIVLAWAGMFQARVAGDYDVGRSDRRRGDRGAVGPVDEVSFDCPACGRTYRASRQVAGRPFACRACDARFTVPQPTAG